MCGLYIPQFGVDTHFLHREMVGEPCIVDDIMVSKHLCVWGGSMCVCVCGESVCECVYACACVCLCRFACCICRVRVCTVCMCVCVTWGN